jgi:hypothetical protein
MSEKGRIEGNFVAYLTDTMDERAWRAMSPEARLLYLATKRRFNTKFPNNGKIYLSTRIAAKELGFSRVVVIRCFHELQHFGFIVVVEAGHLGVNGRGRAPKLRLTELGYMKDPPTRDYQRWDGTPFQWKKPPSKRQNPYAKKQNPGLRVQSRVGYASSPPVDYACSPVDQESGLRVQSMEEPKVDYASSPNIINHLGGAWAGPKSSEPSLELGAKPEGWERNAKTPAERLEPELADDGLDIPMFLRRRTDA